MSTLITLDMQRPSDREPSALLAGLWQYADQQLAAAKRRLYPDLFAIAA